MEKARLDYLINELFSGEWDNAGDASDELAEHPEPEVVSALIKVLSSNELQAQNAAALALREIGDNSAVIPLLNAITGPCNENNNMSTLVYALETLDCSDHFSVIFPLALSDRWDVVISALNILQEQFFNLTKADIEEAQKILADSDVAKESARARRILGSLLKKLSRNIHKAPCTPKRKKNSKA